MSGISALAGGIGLGKVTNMNAILHENRSHYHYWITLLNKRGVPDRLILPDPPEAYEMPTLFEKIIAGDLPATILYRDPRVIAFLDIRPAAPVHILIVPTKPIPTANDIADDDESLIGHMFIVARDLARQQGIAESGYRLVINCNAHGGQEVYHLHVHLLGGRPLGPMAARA
jgi:histidine triad (HIT) family protein